MPKQCEPNPEVSAGGIPTWQQVTFPSLQMCAVQLVTITQAVLHQTMHLIVNHVDQTMRNMCPGKVTKQGINNHHTAGTDGQLLHEKITMRGAV